MICLYFDITYAVVWFAVVQASQHNPPSTAKKSGFTYKMPDSRYTTFGGVLRDDNGDIVDVDASDSNASSGIQADDSLPVNYVVISDQSQLFQHAVSELFHLQSLCVNCASVMNMSVAVYFPQSRAVCSDDAADC